MLLWRAEQGAVSLYASNPRDRGRPHPVVVLHGWGLRAHRSNVRAENSFVESFLLLFFAGSVGQGNVMSVAWIKILNTLPEHPKSDELARYVFGRPAEFRRRVASDAQMQTAMGLLRKAQTPKELLSLSRASVPAATAQNQ